jgi:hypothetical protein
VLVLALFVILVLSIMGLGLAYVVQVEYWLAVTAVKQGAVDLAAESGLEFAAVMLRESPGESYHGGPMPVPMSTSPGANDIEVLINDPMIVRKETILTDDGAGGQIGVKRTTYHVISTAHATAAQIVKCLQADICVSPSRTEITEWKECRR